jgi:tetratricopeptide (TPR) repeat protein
MSHTIGQIKQNHQQSNNSSGVHQNSQKPEPDISSMPISDADYEFLFNQLLEGIAHGWHDRRIVKFFVGLGDRANQTDWVAWLERLRGKASALPPQSKRQLGTMMIRLGELTRSTTELNKIGVASHRIGKDLLFGNVESVWEYVGSDCPPLKDRDATPSLTDRLDRELSERLPTDFNELSSYKVVKEIEVSKLEEPTKAESKSNSAKDSERSSSLAEPNQQDPDLEALATESYWEDSISEERSVLSSSSVADFDSNYSNEPEYSQSELSTPDSAILDESEADLVDFPESIPEAKQITPNTVLSPKAESGKYSSSLRESEEIEAFLSNPTTTEPETDNLQDLASSLHTESEMEAFDIARIMNLIQEDEELARQISQKLTKAIAKTPNRPKFDRSTIELIESWFNLGLKQVSAGELTKAIASWEKALSINPNLSAAWHNRGSALGRLGDYQAAIESFQNALAIDPDNYQAWNDRAHALYQLQNWTEAANSWNNAIEIMPGNHLFWYNRGCALEQLERWDEAIASHEKALEIVPDFQPGRLRYINLVADSSRSN